MPFSSGPALAGSVRSSVLSKMRTLIVDDEPVARKILREHLEQMDEVVIVGEAQDGPSALEAIRELHPQLVLLDLQMPGMGGFDVIRHLESGSDAPVVVIVTAFDKHAIEAFEAGAMDYLLKPVSFERLAQTVDRALKMSAQPHSAAEMLARDFPRLVFVSDVTLSCAVAPGPTPAQEAAALPVGERYGALPDA